MEARSYDVAAGALPADVGRHDAYLITGSPAGVYDDLPWIAPLKTFLRAAKGRAKLVGICFGHQIMAEAFGGRVEKSEKGWGVGLHSYPIVQREPWMEATHLVSVPASHQDQVVLQPPEADVIASSLFTPYAGLAWRDQPAISFQFHPEMSPAFAKALIDRAARPHSRRRRRDRLARRAQRQCEGGRMDQAVPPLQPVMLNSIQHPRLRRSCAAKMDPETSSG